jgi:hypothetical protein
LLDEMVNFTNKIAGKQYWIYLVKDKIRPKLKKQLYKWSQKYDKFTRKLFNRGWIDYMRSYWEERYDLENIECNR